MTSGGDSPGMNAALRAAVATASNLGIDIYAIHEGYAGMIEGGSSFKKLEWLDVKDIIAKGGTVIGSARSQEFRTKEGRKRAVKNLIEHKINNLIVIGGDGSLTGADFLRLVLEKKKKIWVKE